MKNRKYFINTNKINQMNTNFLIKLATITNSFTVMELLKVTTERINAHLAKIDREFSAFRYDSLVSQFQRGNSRPLANSADFKAVYNAAMLSEQMTNGIYSPYFAGKFDPRVIVINWAIEQAFNQELKPLLKNPEVVGVYLEGSDSKKFATKQDVDFNWTIAIDSDDDSIAIYYLKNGAISTSEASNFVGNALKRTQSDIKQATVIRSSLVEAAVWSLVATSSDIEMFKTFIEHYNLTGIVAEKNDQLLNFNFGSIIDNKQVKA